MKNLSLFLLSNIFCFFLHAQPYWQQEVNFSIDVSLNVKEKTLDAFERLSYTNNSPDTLTFIWFHLWPNAYKHDRTAFNDQMLEGGDTRFYFAGNDQRGYINRLNFKVDGVNAATEDHPQHTDIVKLILPKPLPPKQSVTITTPFHVKLPFNFSRGGFDGETFQVTQWYPKPAVYDRKGWHPMPYLNQGEFYSEFGNYEVSITVPADYVIAATGQLQNKEEITWLQQRSGYTQSEKKKNKTASTVKKSTGSIRTRTKTSTPAPRTEGVQQTKTLRYKQDKVHDFAWFANRHFIVKSDSLLLPSGKTVTVNSFFTPAEKTTWNESLQYLKEAVLFYSAELGEYPYNTATVVQGPESFGGGMEYPTITVISPMSSPVALDQIIAHEVGHNWFQGMLASNEQEHPWMDEGMNSYYEKRYLTRKYGEQGKEPGLLLQMKARNKTDQPIETPAVQFTGINYNLVAYYKTAEWMKEIENKLGDERFRQLMQTYFQTWKFKHPYPEDFKSMAAEALGDKGEETFKQLSSKGILPSSRLQGTTVLFPFKKGALKNYLLSPTKNLITIAPAVGSNNYDKIMLGGVLANYGSPDVGFNFLAVPLYATGTSSLTGLGKLNYRFVSGGAIRRTDVFLNAASFHMNKFNDGEGRQYPMRVVKLVPGLRLTLQEKSPRSTVSRYIQWKTFLINEQSLQIRRDSLFGPSDTTIRFSYTTPRRERYLNQLKLVYENSRALYPFDATLQAEQAQDFVRTTFTGNYFFNYAKGGGLSIRLFAGKFSYLNGRTTRKQFATDRYHLNLTGPNGYEDYTYSDYFMGRNRFDGVHSQQIMIRDGAFKVRTDQLSQKIGKTDNWLAAVNFVTTVPKNFNPFSMLPVNIPLRIFADIGSYAEAWDRDEDLDRFLFDAGLQLSFAGETVNIYIPLVYSPVFRNYIKSTITEKRLLKTISFSINFFNKSLKKINRELEF